MRIMIFSPLYNEASIPDDQRICLLGIGFGNVVFGIIIDYNWVKE
jgi:hypothetical protein